MGKQTDTHIAAVNSELTKLKKAADDLQTIEDNFTTLWAKMMTAFDSKGKVASAPIAATVKAEATKHHQAVATGKAAYTSAQSAINTMNTFVTQKDAATINPLAKKSIGKAKKFVVDAKAALSKFSALPTKASLQDSTKSVMQYYS